MASSGLTWKGTLLMVSAMVMMIVSLLWTLAVWYKPDGGISIEGTVLFVLSCIVFVGGVMCIFPLKQQSEAVIDTKDVKQPKTIFISIPEKDLSTREKKEKEANSTASTFPDTLLIIAKGSEESKAQQVPPPYSEKQLDADDEASWPEFYHQLHPESRRLLLPLKVEV